MAEMREARSPARPKGRKALHHIEVHHGKNGGHVVKHVFEMKFKDGDGAYGPAPEPEEHVFGASEGKEALAHIQKHAKIHATEPEEEERATGAEEAAADEEPGENEE